MHLSRVPAVPLTRAGVAESVTGLMTICKYALQGISVQGQPMRPIRPVISPGRLSIQGRMGFREGQVVRWNARYSSVGLTVPLRILSDSFRTASNRLGTAFKLPMLVNHLGTLPPGCV